jgi:ABC-type transport system involved in multi-copper enzyme maturation permease subunit
LEQTMQGAAISPDRALSGAGPAPGTFSRVRLIVAKEVAANLKSLRIPAALFTMTTLFLLSAHLLASDYGQRYTNWEINQSFQHERAEGGGVTYNLHDGGFFYNTGTAPDPPMQQPQPLSMVIKGMDDEADRAVTLGQRIGFGPRQDDNTLSALYDTPDISFLARLLLSLFALFFSLDLITSEKESGTLRALLAHPLGRRELLLGKAVGAAASLLAPFTLAYFGAFAYLYFTEEKLAGWHELVRVLLIYGLGLLYGLVFVSIGLFISTLTTRTKTAVMIALFAWGTLVLVLPSGALLAAKLISPAPSYNRHTAQLFEARQRIKQQERAAPAGAQPRPNRPNKQENLRFFEADRQLTDEYLDSKWRQINSARWLSVLLPAGALAFGASDLASTGASDYHAYCEFLRAGRDEIIDFQRVRWELPEPEGNRLWDELQERINSRQRRPEPLSASARPLAAAAASLVIWTSVFALASYRRFKRYDVR